MAAVTGFFHGGITVSDMERALVFYRDGLGLEQEFDHIRAVYLRIPGGGFVELLEYVGVERMPAASRPCDYGAGHLCLYVDDVTAVHARLVGLGFAARSSDVVDITAGPNAGARSVYMIDPDGYAVELFQKRPGA